MALLGEDDQYCHLEQVSFVVGPDFVISFQEGHDDVFDPVRARIRNGGARAARWAPTTWPTR